MMRAYIPVRAQDARRLLESGSLPGPHPAWVVDPQWREGAPDVVEEEWEFEAADCAAQALAGPGVVLAVDVGQVGPIDDGATEVAEDLRRRSLAAVLTVDLAWYAVQELSGLLDTLEA
jgi:hypothetical protein